MASSFSFEAIGTMWQIDIYSVISLEQEKEIYNAVKKRIDIFDKTYSRFRDDSLVMEIANHSGVFIFPDDALPIMSLYRELYVHTDGFVTPLIGQVLVDTGYDASYTLIPKKELHNTPRWDEVMQYKHPILTTKIPLILDFGAAGKGYLIDLVGEILESYSIGSYCIDAGGDILHKGDTAISVGLENPVDEKQVIGTLVLQNKSICGSAGNRRKWAQFHHIINPKTISSPTHILAVWVIADSTLLADALTTCLFFVNPTLLQSYYVFEYCIVYADLSVVQSDNFNANLFIKSNTI